MINGWQSIEIQILMNRSKSTTSQPCDFYDGLKYSIGYGLGSGSDHYGFNQLVGSSDMDATYTYDSAAQGYIAGYPLYHTSYEAFSMMKKFVDPDFTVSFIYIHWVSIPERVHV